MSSLKVEETIFQLQSTLLRLHRANPSVISEEQVRRVAFGNVSLRETLEMIDLLSGEVSLRTNT